MFWVVVVAAIQQQLLPSVVGAFRTAEPIALRMGSTVLRETRAKPIDPSGWPSKFPAKDLCSRCGLCETTYVTEVKDACAFLGPGMARIDVLEEAVHGRNRLANDDGESRFGVLHEPIRLAKGFETQAQWTGVVTGIALAMLESETVDAVVCIASNTENGFASPEPILAKTAEDILKGRGVKPSLAPSLRVLDEIRSDPSIKNLLFCGVGCAVQAFRAVDLGLDQVYVLGTNCADNSPTPAAAQNFIREGVRVDSTEAVLGYEFMQDFTVHVKSEDSYTTKPYFSLPGTIAEASIAPSCRACFDYTNGLADVVVGYMGAPLDGRMDQSFQTLTVRNEKGARMVEIAQRSKRIAVGNVAKGEGSHESLASQTVAADALVAALVGNPVPQKGMPEWVGRIVAYALRTLGPKGTNFAKYSIDYHVLRNYLWLLHRNDGDHTATTTAMPRNARDIVAQYQQNDTAFADLVSKLQKPPNGHHHQ